LKEQNESENSCSIIENGYDSKILKPEDFEFVNTKLIQGKNLVLMYRGSRDGS
jgi:hypothetical protein